MSDSTITKRVTLDVEATNSTKAGLASVRADYRRTLDELERDTSARLKAGRGAANDFTAPPPAGTPPKPAKPAAEKGVIDSLKSTLGEESALGNVGKILVGGGAIAGVAVVGNAISGIAAGLKESAVALQTGKANWADVVDKTLAENALIGGAYRGTRDFADAVDGTAVRMARLESITKAVAIGAAGIAQTFARAKASIESLVAQKQAIQITVDKEAAMRTIAGLPPWLNDAAARRIELTAQLTSNAVQVEKEVKDARKASIDDTAKAIAATTDFETKQRLRANEKVAADAAERGVRRAAAERDAAQKAGFKGATGADFDGGDAALKARSDAMAAQVRQVAGSGADDGSEFSKRLLAGRLESLKQEAALGDRAKANEAERLEIQAKYADRARELQKIAESGGDSKAREEAGRQFFALQQQQEQEQAAAARRQADAARRDDVGRRGELTKITVDALRDEAAVGDRLKAFDAERLEIAQKFLELRKQLLATAEDPAKSAEVRAAAQKAVGDLPKRQQAAEADVDRRRAEDAISRRGSLARIEIDAMRTRASLGDRSLEIEAKRLEIREKYAEQELELNRQIASLSGVELARAVALKASLAKRQAAEVEAADLERLRSALVTSLPTANAGDGSAAAALLQERFFASQQTRGPSGVDRSIYNSAGGDADLPKRIASELAAASAASQAKRDDVSKQLVEFLRTLSSKLDGTELLTYRPKR